MRESLGLDSTTWERRWVELEQHDSLDLSARMMRERLRSRLLGQAAESVRVGRFRLLRRCGSGGEGGVYEAWDPSFRTRVALKCLSSVRASEHAALQHEFRVLSELVHPNLVAMHELFCIEGAWFFTMEYLRGEDFVAHARARDAVALYSITAQLLQGIAAIHGAGFVHRDLKPSNVLVEPCGRLVILDFGLVAPRARVTEVSGTRAYMAPEQWRSGKAEPASDLYGVGATLFEALAGRKFRRDVARDWLANRGDVLATLCRDLLRDDPAARPSVDEALSRLAQASEVQRGAVPSFARSKLGAFVGRERELSRVRGAVQRATREGPRMLLVSGESGWGKSRLLERSIDMLRAEGVLVFEGRCYARETTPYRAFDDLVEGVTTYLQSLPRARRDALLEGLVPALCRLFPRFHKCSDALDRGEPREPGGAQPGDRARSFGAFRALLERLALRGAVVLCIDDLQWMDGDGVELLQRLFAVEEGVPLLLVGTYRTEEVRTSGALRQLLGDLARCEWSCAIERLALEPLALDDARALVGALCPERARHALVEAAGGVPFLLRELALADELPEAVDALARLRSQRLERLDPAQRAVLALLAVAGRPLSVAMALSAAAQPGAGFTLLLPLLAQKLVRLRDVDGERCLELYDGGACAPVLTLLTPARVRALHLALADAHASLEGAASIRCVEHLVLAGEKARAARWARRAADHAASQLAWSRAADLLALAIDADAEAADAPLLQRLGELFGCAGRHGEAAQAYMQAAHRTPLEKRTPLERLAAQHHLRAGDGPTGRALLCKLLGEVGLRLPSSPLGAVLGHAGLRAAERLNALFPRTHSAELDTELLATLGAAYRELWLSDPIASLLVHGWLRRAARAVEGDARFEALTYEVVLQALGNGPNGREVIARELASARACLARGATPYACALVDYAAGVAAIHAEGQPRAAIALLENADRLLVRHGRGVQFERAGVAIALDHALEATGQLARLRRTVRAREREQEPNDQLGRALRDISLPVVLLMEDRAELVQQLLEPRFAPGSAAAPLIDYVAHGRMADALLYLGRAEEAHDHVEHALRAPVFSLLLRGRAIRNDHALFRARIAAAVYDRTRVLAHKRRARAELRRVARSEPLPAAMHQLIAASLAQSDGSSHEARALLGSAIRLLAQAEAENALWCARYRLAELERSSARLDEARAWLRAEGVRAPERWVSLTIPGCGAWR